MRLCEPQFPLCGIVPVSEGDVGGHPHGPSGVISARGLRPGPLALQGAAPVLAGDRPPSHFPGETGHCRPLPASPSPRLGLLRLRPTPPPATRLGLSPLHTQWPLTRLCPALPVPPPGRSPFRTDGCVVCKMPEREYLGLCRFQLQSQLCCKSRKATADGRRGPKGRVRVPVKLYRQTRARAGCGPRATVCDSRATPSCTLNSVRLARPGLRSESVRS